MVLCDRKTVLSALCELNKPYKLRKTIWQRSVDRYLESDIKSGWILTHRDSTNDPELWKKAA